MGRWKKLGRLALLVAVLGAVTLLAYHVGFFDAGYRARLQGQVQALGAWAPVAFVAVKILTITLALPAVPVTMVGGALFGPIWGSLLNLGASTCGAMVTFGITRSLKLQGHAPPAIEAALAGEGFSVMVSLRLLPIFPFNLINYSAGLTGVRFRDYFWGTLVGSAPGTVIFTSLGSSVAAGDPRGATLALAGFGLLAAIPAAIRLRRQALAARGS